MVECASTEAVCTQVITVALFASAKADTIGMLIMPGGKFDEQRYNDSIEYYTANFKIKRSIQMS